MLYIAFLRGINVGGKRLVAMADLRELLNDLGFVRARSLLQSGNIIFEAGAGAGSTAALEGLLEGETERRFNMPVDYFVRSVSDLESARTGNPYPKEAECAPAHLVVTFLKNAPDATDARALQAAIAGPERATVVGKLAYIVYPAGIAASRVTNGLIERKLRTRATGRNWNTLLKLSALARP